MKCPYCGSGLAKFSGFEGQSLMCKRCSIVYTLR
jgi:uncharacterized protein (DUF983 family)